MKKYLTTLIILAMVFPKFIFALTTDSNVTGNAMVASPNTNSGGTCTSTNYWLGFKTAEYEFQGMRISFYKDSGEQVGNSVDVFTWGNQFYWADDWERPQNDAAKELENKYGFITYTRNRNHTYYYTKVDYAKGNLVSETPKDNIISGKYYFYFDTVAYANTEFKGCGYWKVLTSKYYFVSETRGNEFTEGGKKYIYKKICSTPVSGPLFFTLQDGNKTKFREYFLQPEVMKRYLHLAKADELVDIEEGDYTLLAEPIGDISACVGGTYSGCFTVSDIGYIYNNVSKFGFNGVLTAYPGTLAISEDETISGVNFTAKSPIPAKVDPANFLSTEGLGMAIIHGHELCEPNCKSGKYQIVYRTIDLNNPFLTLDGTNRTLSEKSNWYEKGNTIDASIYGKTPLYTITLTPTKIKEIRESNKTFDYSKIVTNSTSTTFADSEFKKNFGL